MVIAIIALLAALLLPALRHARDKAKSIDCLNNLRQIHIGFEMWAADNNNRFPWSYYWNESLGSAGYFGAGEAYYGRTRWTVLRCRAEVKYDGNNGRGTMYDDETGPLSSYGLAWIVNCYYYAQGVFPGAKPRRWNYPVDGFFYNPDTNEKAPLAASQAMYVTDIDRPFHPSHPSYNLTGWEVDTEDYRYRFRHAGGTIIGLFLDGHAEARRHFLDTSGTIEKRNYQYIYGGNPDGGDWGYFGP